VTCAKNWYKHFFVAEGSEEAALHEWRNLVEPKALKAKLRSGDLVIKRYDTATGAATARLQYVFSGVVATPHEQSRNPGFTSVVCRRVLNAAGKVLGSNVEVGPCKAK